MDYNDYGGFVDADMRRYGTRRPSKDTAQIRSLVEEIERLHRGVKEVTDAIGDQQIIDGQIAKRLLLALLPATFPSSDE